MFTFSNPSCSGSSSHEERTISKKDFISAAATLIDRPYAGSKSCSFYLWKLRQAFDPVIAKAFFQMFNPGDIAMHAMMNEVHDHDLQKSGGHPQAAHKGPGKYGRANQEETDVRETSWQQPRSNQTKDTQ
jgi:hypothetical protein